MLRRCRPHVLLFVVLCAPFGVLTPSRSARAQASPPGASTASPPSATAPATGSPAPSAVSPAPSAPAAAPPVAPSPTQGPATTGAPPAAASPPGASASPASPPISPARDQQDLAAQGAQRPESDLAASNPHQVFSEDWWGRARPIVQLHGYFRTRAELFQNFFLNRHSSSFHGNDPQYLWPVPLDQTYTPVVQANSSPRNVQLCGPSTPAPTGFCYDKTESGANMRLRLDPEIDISDNLRIATQIDLLDNVVLGSTPNSYAMAPGGSSTPTTSGGSNPASMGYRSAGYNAYAPVGFFASTQGPPTAGVNSWTNSIAVKRVWAEYMTPVGQIRFGRMPSHWGLGMVENAGDGIDSDYQTTLDRIMFVTGLRSMDLYVGGSWDFMSTGPTALPGATTANAWDVYGGQPYNTCNLCNVNQWTAFVAHRTNAELQRLALSRSDVVVNGGLYAKLRSQELDVVQGNTPQTVDLSANNNGLELRRAWSFTPDLWLQVLWKKLRFEAEAAVVWGEVSGALNVQPGQLDTGHTIDIREWGITTQLEYRALEDKLQLELDFGYASGDPWAYNTASGQNEGAIQPQSTGVQGEYNVYGPLSTFAFHPDYRVDLIFFRNILTRVEGAYYFKPTVNYDFIRHADGEKLGGGASIIWSRASQVVQTPGHKSDLGIELDGQIYYQSKDGSLNDDPSKIGGFYTMLQYGVFFPLGGLSYLGNTGVSPSAAQILRLYLGVVF